MGYEKSTFEDLLYDRLIPEFCSDAARGCEVSGYRGSSSNISDEDAHYFLRALEAGLVHHDGGGRYRCPQSATFEQLFWEGRKGLQPRPFTLWLEPVITIAGLARLCFDYAWPIELMGTQSADWAFDLVTMLPGQRSEHIAAEVKKTGKEIDDLLRLMCHYGNDPQAPEPKSGKERNAFKKVQALRLRRPPIFWALGPAGSSHVFNMRYRQGGLLVFLTADESALTFGG
jgi:hypothetical protein